MKASISKKEHIAQGLQQFLQLCICSKNVNELEELLKFFMTIEEQNALATRILLIKELLKGEKSQREIAAELEISIAKITRGSNMLKLLPDEVKEKLVQQLLQKHESL